MAMEVAEEKEMVYGDGATWRRCCNGG